ncbi:MAG: HlyD family secretion protein [Candidatus Aminicenantes bacterium]|nr:HlyD family secretion protein [Candidatus Aminicenantes bacterium]
MLLVPALVLILAASVSCGGPKGSSVKAPAPAKVENPAKEAELTTLTLTPEAVARLGIETVKAGIITVPRALRLGGEIVARPGSRAIVSAPSAGVVLAPKDRTLPLAGANVVRGQAILRFLPLPADKDLTSARNDLAVKEAQLDAAAAKARRAAELLPEKAASERSVEESRAELAAAEAAAKAARARWHLVDDLATLALVSSFDGVIERLEVAAGQIVPAGTLLFEVADFDPVWIRVPVYVGDLGSVDPKATAAVQVFGRSGESEGIQASPVPGPPLSDARSASSDLFYQLPNRDGGFRLGQKVRVNLVLRDKADALAVPGSAVLYDMQGGTWVYVRTAPTVFVRRRVELHYAAGGLVVLGRGLDAGEEVVTAGAAELFGTEFGAGK